MNPTKARMKPFVVKKSSEAFATARNVGRIGLGIIPNFVTRYILIKRERT